MNNTQGLSQAEIEALEDDLDDDGMPKDDEPAELDADDEDDAADDAAPAAKLSATEEESDADADGGDDTLDEAASAAKPAAKQAEPGIDAIAAVAGDDEKDADPPQFTVPDTDFAGARKALAERVAKVEQEWADGTKSDEERAADLAKIQDERDELLREETRAQTIAEINRQAQTRAHEQVLNELSKASLKAGEIDYSDEKSAKAFDAMIRAIAADPDNADKSFRALANQAHNALCASRGIARKTGDAADPSSAAKDDAKEQAAKGKKASRGIDKSLIPPTLSRVPPAADATISGDEFSHLASLEGADLEKAVTRMTPEQQERWLNA